MANIDSFLSTLLKHEGGFVNDPADRGGATNKGVTIDVWRRYGYDKDGDGDVDVNDLRLIDRKDVYFISKTLYWDKVYGDYIGSQSVAEFLFDWAYNSGPSVPIRKLQHILGPEVVNDGIMGRKTLKALNCANDEYIFDQLKKSRENFFHAIVRSRPANKKFLNGWLNRLNTFTFKG